MVPGRISLDAEAVMMHDSGEPLHFPSGISTDWYDGPVHGFLERGQGGPVYDFQMVAWDDRQRARIYVLRPIAINDFRTLAAALGEPLDRPWRGLRGDERVAEELRMSAGPVEFVVLANEDLESPNAVLPASIEQVAAMLKSDLRETPSDSDYLSYSDASFDEWRTLFR